jgi:hypothetical protein
MFNPWITKGTKMHPAVVFSSTVLSCAVFFSICSSNAPLTQNYHYAAWMLFLGHAIF